MASQIDDFGTPEAYNHYAVGWAHAMDTPYQWTKQVASHWGGTRNGTIVHWPNGIKAKGEVRTQFHHVIDVAATVLEAAGLPEPHVRATASSRSPTKACRMAYILRRRDGRRAARDAVLRDVLQPRHLPQGLDRGHTPQHPVGDGTPTAAVRRRRLGALRARRLDAGARPRGRAAREARGAAAALPHRGRQVQRAAARRPPRRALQLRSGRPAAAHPGQLAAALRRHGPAHRELGRVLKNKSHSVTAEIVVPESGAEGVIIAQGGAFGGWSLYAQGRQAGVLLQPLRPAALQGRRRASRLPPGKHQVRMEFAYDGGGLGKGGDVDALRRRDARSARAASTRPCRCSSPPTRRPTSASDSATPVSDDLRPARDRLHRARATGCEIDLGEDAEDADHLITAEERLQHRDGAAVEAASSSHRQADRERRDPDHAAEEQGIAEPEDGHPRRR